MTVIDSLPTADHPALARRGRLVALAVGAVLVPWCVLLAATLPAAAQAQNWSLAWVGLDGATAAAAFGTAHLLARTDGRAALAATAGATLLLVDSWFDVCTSGPGLARAFSIAEAVAVEVPLAVAGIWLALALTRGAR